MSNGFIVLPKFNVCVANIFSNFESHFFGSVGKDIKSHFVHLDGSRIFLLMVIDVSHIDPNSSCKRVLLPLDDLIIFGQGFLEHSTCLQAKGMIKGDSK